MSIQVLRESHALPRATGADEEILAIGDIHGRADLFEALLRVAEREPKRARRRVLVLLGDLIDRGPENFRTLRLARMAGERAGADETVALMGNHEAMLRLALDSETDPSDALDAFEHWMRNGGDRVVREFAALIVDKAFHSDERLEFVRARLPRAIRDWLGDLRASWRSGDVLFVHAGVNPARALDDFLAAPWNIPLDRLVGADHWAWVRAPFLQHRPGLTGHGGAFVVHGHSPLDQGFTRDHAEQIERFRLNLDAGSGLTGMAKLAVLRGAWAEVITVKGAANGEM